ncbi:MAG: AbrB/MazE/SpoVT family DNA-binding domain-containing protein [Clostridia bacterium]|nr:AbrB/MazE/SpoVT family DNA-binding domain-containing protein [Clostridia bacterium]
MKGTGMSRPIDELGRVVIPKEIRKALGLNVKEPLEIYLEDEKIILKKREDKCVFCGNQEKLTQVSDKNICKACIEKIKLLEN